MRAFAPSRWLAAGLAVAMAGTTPQAHAAAPARDPVMPPPVVEQPPPAIERAKRELQHIAATRDVDALLAHAHDGTQWSFGGDHGRAGFQAMWLEGEGLDRFWDEFDRVLALPGRWSDAGGELRYCTPYVFCDALPEGFDPFETVVVLGTGVAMRAGPSPDAAVLARVDHAVLASPSDDSGQGDWIPVRVASGAQGYIAGRWVRRPIDFRLGVAIAADGQWRLEYFIAGD